MNLDHVALAVQSISQTMPLFELLLGERGSPAQEVGTDGVRVAFLGSGPATLELVEPTTPASAVARFLERRGPGLHHVAFRVPDLEAALERLASADLELIDKKPRAGAHGRRVAFIHPRSTHGVLVELVEAP